MGITGLVWINDGEHNRAVSPDKVASMEGWVHGRLGVKGHKKTHCKRGHEFAPETFRVRTKPNGNEVRDCLLCEEERGLIHSSCNLMIGQAKDSPALLELAAQYLRKHLDSCLAKAVEKEDAN